MAGTASCTSTRLGQPADYAEAVRLLIASTVLLFGCRSVSARDPLAGNLSEDDAVMCCGWLWHPRLLLVHTHIGLYVALQLQLVLVLLS